MKNQEDKGYSTRLRKAATIILCAIIVAGLSAPLLTVSAQTLPGIIIVGQASNSNQQNSTLVMEVNQTFTMTVNITDYTQLYAYQVVFKYNNTMLNITDVTFPSNVFASQSAISTSYTTLSPNETVASLTDLNDHFGVGAVVQTLVGPTGIDVSNGILFQVNFTVVEAGETTIHLSTVNDTAQLVTATSPPWYTFMDNPDQALYGGENDIFDLANATLVVLAAAPGQAQIVPPPVAAFTAKGSPAPKNTLILLPNAVGSGLGTSVLCNLTTFFNASASYDNYGTITEYFWSFGDGNTTVVKATGSPNDSLITHVFTGVGTFDVNLTLVAQSGPNATQISTSYIYPITVDLAVPLFDWMPFIYAVFGIIVAAIVVSSVRSAMRKARRRRLTQQKVSRMDASEQPPTETATT
jgi:hypothetical protein